MPLMDDVGLPLRESVAAVVGLRNRYGPHDRIRAIASGKLIKLIMPADVAGAVCVAADLINSALGFMFAPG